MEAEINVLDNVKIHSYKHNKKIHRVWNNITVLDNNPHELVVANFKTKVVESNGRYWNTKEPAICFFYDDKWYNVIAMLKEDGIYYYCNVSSPYIFDGEAIKYIDYDLDLRVDANYQYKILDREEYKYHAKIMNYDEKLKVVIEHSLEDIIKLATNKEGAFNHDVVMKYFDMYKKYNKFLKEKETND